MCTIPISLGFDFYDVSVVLYSIVLNGFCLGAFPLPPLSLVYMPFMSIVHFFTCITKIQTDNGHFKVFLT